MTTNNNGLKIVQDDDGHYYLIDINDKDNFNKWIQYCGEGKFDAMKEFNYFNQQRIESPYNLVIYQYEEKE